MGHPVLYQTIFYLDYNNATPKKKISTEHIQQQWLEDETKHENDIDNFFDKAKITQDIDWLLHLIIIS